MDELLGNANVVTVCITCKSVDDALKLADWLKGKLAGVDIWASDARVYIDRKL